MRAEGRVAIRALSIIISTFAAIGMVAGAVAFIQFGTPADVEPVAKGGVEETVRPAAGTGQDRTGPPADTAASPGREPAAVRPQPPVKTVYGAWTVTCPPGEPGAKQQPCSAVLTLDRVSQDRRQVIGAWLITRSQAGALVTVLQTPIIQTAQSSGVQIEHGVELQLDAGPVHRFAYTTCGMHHCEAVTPMSEAFTRESRGASKAIITLRAVDGTRVNLNVGSLKGIDQAIAAIAR